MTTEEIRILLLQKVESGTEKELLELKELLEGLLKETKEEGR